MSQAPRPNLIVVVSDTLRACDVGCYGSTVTRTPNLDAFARHSVRFERAFPESLPTIPVRRALHSGRRAFPFSDYRPVKWDIVRLPGWQPLANEEDTLAENLAVAGYHTGFVTDTLPYFAPGYNFTRGFWQWEYVRGQQNDRWKSPHMLPDDVLRRYGDPEAIRAEPHGLLALHLANTAHVRAEEDTSTSRTFRRAMDFLDENRGAQPFYLLVDCFDPHEPWDAPERYYRMYGDPGYDGPRTVFFHYRPAAGTYSDEEVAFGRANYRGLVTLVDRWFGELIGRVDALGLAANTAIFVISDHGTNFCDNPRGIIGKPGTAMYPGLMWLPFLARLPDEAGAGAARDELVYNLDLTATLYDLAGVAPEQRIDGRSLTPLLRGEPGWRSRPYVTCRYDNALCCIDDRTWALGGIDGAVQEVFDLEADPDCMRPLPESEATRRWALAWERLLDDAGGGPFIDPRVRNKTDAIGQRAG